MDKIQQNSTVYKIAMLFLVAIISRFLPHLPNMTAMGALAIFSGAMIKPRWVAVAAPLAVMLFTDFVIGFHNTMLFVYAAWIGLTLFSQVLSGKTGARLWAGLGGMTVFATLWFFVVSNFGVWFVGELYPLTMTGLIECFIAALPFLGNQFAGDLIYTAVLFGSWAYLERKVLSSRFI